MTLDIAGELAALDASPLVAALLRGMIETSTTQRVNLVNAAALAKTRGISVVERKSSDAGGFAAQLSVSGASGGRTTTVAGTVAGGETRLTRLNEYRLDIEPTDVMLITNHHDRPGMIGRIGQTLGAADVNISAMHVGRSAPRADALMVLALDDDVSPDVEAAIRAQESVVELWTIRLGRDR